MLRAELQDARALPTEDRRRHPWQKSRRRCNPLFPEGNNTPGYLPLYEKSSTNERNKNADANHLELSLLCEVVKEDHPEGAGTENQPYLKKQPSARIVGQ